MREAYLGKGITAVAIVARVMNDGDDDDDDVDVDVDFDDGPRNSSRQLLAAPRVSVPSSVHPFIRSISQPFWPTAFIVDTVRQPPQTLWNVCPFD
ncbi:unnamed protein product [Enterobius vermicularis]|uniref:Secreted protein n=1 Tax=Enterobius vermicularis TaxID=51028 RepID=A0A0N4VFZ6_ENTVE|nr:unnamed protein product [Enterobius vermicularis]